MASTRLPQKPLLLIHGVPMILHVVRRASLAQHDSLCVATDNQKIFDVVTAAGFDAQMTRADHVSGTDRLAEVAQIRGWHEDDLVINVQGDEPLIPASVINQVAELLIEKPECLLSTLVEKLKNLDELEDPSAVKAVVSSTFEALYFSRAPIPASRDALMQKPINEESRLERCTRHIGIYAYRVKALQAFSGWEPSSLELIESLEQLRFLDHGARIAAKLAVDPVPAGVDTAEDLSRLNQLPASRFELPS
jgi:3-deoxy-manno-octulosonate cytidylyltransferase (CMP-KDO synthetase)